MMSSDRSLFLNSVEVEDGLRKFQSGELKPDEEEWRCILPKEAQESLDRPEVLRQSVIFEVIKAERDYVRDLRLIRDVFIDPMVNTHTLPPNRMEGFIREVFYNVDEILAHHQRLLDALFERQREQHPLIQSIADVILEG